MREFAGNVGVLAGSMAIGWGASERPVSSIFLLVRGGFPKNRWKAVWLKERYVFVCVFFEKAPYLLVALHQGPRPVTGHRPGGGRFAQPWGAAVPAVAAAQRSGGELTRLGKQDYSPIGAWDG